jgi:Right handed beta helix region
LYNYHSKPLCFDYNSSQINISQVDVSEHAYTAFFLSDVKDVKIVNCKISNLGLVVFSNTIPDYSYDGIFIGGYTKSSNITIQSCKFDNISGTTDPFLDENIDDGDGIHIQGASINVVENITIKECNFNKCSRRGIKIQSGNNISIINNVFYGCKTAIGITMVFDVTDVDVQNNKFNYCHIVCGANGDNFQVAKNIEFVNNKVTDVYCLIRTASVAKIDGFTMRGNIINTVKTTIIDGIIRNGVVEKNEIKDYALALDPSYYMAFLLAKGSQNVKITENEISSTAASRCVLYVQDETDLITVSNNNINLPLTQSKEKYLIHFSDPKTRKVEKGNRSNLKVVPKQ